MDSIDGEFSNLKRRVYEECRRLNHRYSTPAKITVERNNDAWELPAFKLIDPSDKTYFLFAPSSDVQRGDVIVWMGLERWHVSGLNRMPDRIFVDAQQEDAQDSTQGDEFDDLMPIFKRKLFDRDIATLVAQAQAKNEPLSLLMVDLDNFKAVNDTHGHQVGDETLIGYAEILKAGIEGKGGKAYRLSGGADEVAILLPNFSLTESEAVAERLRKSFENSQVSSKNLRVNVSIGVACFPDHAENPTALSECADKALYQAKRLGRNLVRISGEREELSRPQRSVERRQPDPQGLTSEEGEQIKKAYYTGGWASCPRDGTRLRIDDASGHESVGDLLVLCYYCGLQDNVPGAPSRRSK